MREVSQDKQDQLERIKKNIKTMVDGNGDNIQRAHEFKKFVFENTLSDQAKNSLNAVGKPTIQFNICEAFISRLSGEFSKNEPDIILNINDDTQVTPQLMQQKEVIEGHLRYIMKKCKTDGTEYNLFTDFAAGGFSSAEVYYDYKHPKTFQQEVCVKKTYDSSMTYFDLLSKDNSKRDARWAVQLFPKSKDDIEDEWGIDVDDVKFTDSGEGFDWFYMQGEEKILILAKYVEIKHKRDKLYKIVYIDNGQEVTKEMLKSEYDDFAKEWTDSGRIEVLPEPVEERSTLLNTVDQYILIGNKVLKHEKLISTNIPLVNFSNSQFFTSRGRQTEEMTRPYLYNIQGAQKLFDQLGIALANESQNLGSQKIIVPFEGIVDQKYIENPQAYEVLPYHCYDPANPERQLPAPMFAQRTAFPPEIFALFQYIPTLFQNILGSYDAQLGINNNQLSGAAIEKGAIQSNSSAMPFITTFLHSYTRIAELVVELIPKIYIHPMSLPIIDKEGTSRMQTINKTYTDEMDGQQKYLKLDYSPEMFSVNVEAGSSFSAQKSQAMTLLIQLSQAFPGFAQFMNSMGLKVLLDNVDIKGADLLKLMVEQYQQQQQQQAAQAQQNNPEMIKLKNEQANIQREAKKDQMQAQLSAAELQLKQKDIENDSISLALKAQESKGNMAVQVDKHNAEKMRALVDLTMQQADLKHKQSMDVANIIMDHHVNERRHEVEAGRLHHDVSRTVLEHNRHEAESKKEESKENM